MVKRVGAMVNEYCHLQLTEFQNTHVLSYVLLPSWEDKSNMLRDLGLMPDN